MWLFEVLFLCAMQCCWDNKYVQDHCGQHRLTTWGLQMACTRQLFKQNSPSMSQHGRMAQSLMAIYHFGHPAEKFFFRFPFKQLFPYFFPTWFMQQILLPFISLPFTVFFQIHLQWPSRRKMSSFLTKVSCTFFCVNKLFTIHIQNQNPLNENFHEKEDKNSYHLLQLSFERKCCLYPTPNLSHSLERSFVWVIASELLIAVQTPPWDLGIWAFIFKARRDVINNRYLSVKRKKADTSFRVILLADFLKSKL